MIAANIYSFLRKKNYSSTFVTVDVYCHRIGYFRVSDNLIRLWQLNKRRACLNFAHASCVSLTVNDYSWFDCRSRLCRTRGSDIYLRTALSTTTVTTRRRSMVRYYEISSMIKKKTILHVFVLFCFSCATFANLYSNRGAVRRLGRNRLHTRRACRVSMGSIKIEGRMATPCRGRDNTNIITI